MPEQPIDTAPQDATLILLWGQYWSDEQGMMKSPLVGQWSAPNNRWEVFGPGGRFGVRPSVWWPLPIPSQR